MLSPLALWRHQDLHDVNVKAQDNKGLCDEGTWTLQSIVDRASFFFFHRILTRLCRSTE